MEIDQLKFIDNYRAKIKYLNEQREIEKELKSQISIVSTKIQAIIQDIHRMQNIIVDIIDYNKSPTELVLSDTDEYNFITGWFDNISTVTDRVR